MAGRLFKKDNIQMRSVWHIPENEDVWPINTPLQKKKNLVNIRRKNLLNY